MMGEELAQLVVIARFMEIYEEEGEEAAIAWAESQEKKLTQPALTLVD